MRAARRAHSVAFPTAYRPSGRSARRRLGAVRSPRRRARGRRSTPKTRAFLEARGRARRLGPQSQRRLRPARRSAQPDVRRAGPEPRADRSAVRRQPVARSHVSAAATVSLHGPARGATFLKPSKPGADEQRSSARDPRPRLGGVPPLLKQNISERPPDLPRRAERHRVIALGEDLSLRPSIVEPHRDPNREPAGAARERALVLGLDDQVEVVRAARRSGRAESRALLAAGERGAHHLDAALGAEARHAGDAHRQVKRRASSTLGRRTWGAPAFAPVGLRPAPFERRPRCGRRGLFGAAS